jgi:hypothetical protein
MEVAAAAAAAALALACLSRRLGQRRLQRQPL